MRTLREDTRLLAFALCLAGALLAAGAAPAHAQAPLALHADARERGWIGATLQAPPGTVVTVSEDGAPLAAVTAAAAATRLPRLARWRCDRRARALVATAADGATAAATIRTPSCRGRLAVDAPRRARPGRRVALRIRDRWGLGDLRASVCVLPPGGPPRCRERAPGTRAAAARAAGGVAAARAHAVAAGDAQRPRRAAGRAAAAARHRRLDDPAARRLSRAPRCAAPASA